MESKGNGIDSSKLEFVRGTLDVLILKALVWGPLHGYAITSFIRRQSDDALLLEEGTLYPALWRLESRGLLAAEWGLSENNRKAKFYRLTSEGRRHLRQEVKIWQAYAAAVAKVLAATQLAEPEEVQ
ncbi:MAG TPA: PadR family transcriptional regulator [Candidatus Sulfotelmatobacter sp.]|nr:PadR family transcriptional regulator [Candidatus Sulfotelmatobacter sp.]